MVGRRFEDLDVWRKARALAVGIYRCSEQTYFRRDHGLRDQIRRASVSVVSNIAEGYERDGNRELLQFLSHAKGSCGELRAQLHIARDLLYLDAETYRDLLEKSVEISKMLAGLMRYVRASGMRGSKFQAPIP